MADRLSGFDDVIEEASREWDVDPRLLKAVILAESGGNPNAVSRAGAQGLGQIMPSTQRELRMTNAFDPVQSIWGAAQYLSKGLDAERDPARALLYYHGGPGWRQSFGPESTAYVPSVVRQYAALAPAGGEAAPKRVQLAKADTGTATDATPAPVTSEAPKVTDDEFLRSTGAIPSSNGAAKTQPAKASGTPQKAPETSSDDDFLKSTGAAPATRKEAPPADALADAITSPEALGADRPAGETLPTRAQIANALAPAPDTEYGNLPLSWVARDTKTGALRFAMPNMIRAPLQELFGAGGEGGPGMTTTVDPETGAVSSSLSPLAGVMAGFGANPLRFSGPTPTFVAPGSLDRQADLRGVNAVDPQAAARAATEAGPTSPTGVPPPKPDVAAPAQTEVEAVPREHAAWVGDVRSRVNEVLQENEAAGGPASLSAAATPPQEAALSPAKTKAYRRVSELNQVLSPIEGHNVENFVEGSNPTLAERSGDPVISQRESILRERSADKFDPQLKANNDARVKQFDDQVISDVQAADLKEAQEKAAERDGQAIVDQAGPVDATSMAASLKAKMADPRIQENPEVFSVIKDLHDRLYDADGNLKSDPMAFWGMHDRLQNMLKKAKDPMSATSNERFSLSQINDFKKMVDDGLDRASNGAFRRFLDNQAEFLKQENAYNLLAKFRPKMTNKDGTILANRFHQFVTDLAVRRGKPGIDPAMDIPDSVMQNLINIDQDLKRASRIDMGKSRGSQTNLFFTLSRAMGIGAAHAVTALGSHAHGGLGNVVLQQGIKSVEENLANWRLNRQVRRHLEPPEGGLIPAPGNYLNPPP